MRRNLETDRQTRMTVQIGVEYSDRVVLRSHTIADGGVPGLVWHVPKC